jgi:hypothetical protein
MVPAIPRAGIVCMAGKLLNLIGRGKVSGSLLPPNGRFNEKTSGPHAP